MRVRVVKQPFSAARLVNPLMGMLLVVYLGYHVLHGERGLYALVREQAELSRLQQEIADTRLEREKLELKVSHLRDGSLDRDLLDEQMRRMMGVMRNGELVVLTGNSR
jgi:cell division protein FtsB